MKSLIAVATVAVAAIAAPAFAQDQVAPTTGVYANLGYAHSSPGDADLDTIQGRIGYRVNNWFGVEGELSGGLGSDEVSIAPGVDAKVKLKHQEAIYGVGFLPLTPQWDLIGRVGYGNTRIRTSSGGVSASDNQQSWNFGGGAQYNIDGLNGIRADYTRYEFEGGDGHADVLAVAYNRKF
ncbi:porin family protein [Phenylobacterium sp. LjRoot225]|uniref:porin family protein n=1 Tax=Phenylobacterium sp. LjRoot225 TaxID=3342285 RepID=UPI003ECE54DF